MSKEDTKNLIITNYLNTINLGNNTLGVKVAAKRYFNKNLSDLTLSECAVLASITKNPSKLNPISGREKNAERRQIVLQYMYDQGFISKEEQEKRLQMMSMTGSRMWIPLPRRPITTTVILRTS